MSDPVTLEQAKAHLRVLHYYEDDYIAALIPVAAQAVADYIDRPLDHLICVDLAGNLKAPLRHAMLLMIGDLYANREAQGAALAVNITCQNLLAAYRRLGV
ncbi:MAG: head-tail connector protein [Flavobacteriales bacterium]